MAYRVPKSPKGSGGTCHEPSAPRRPSGGGHARWDHRRNPAYRGRAGRIKRGPRPEFREQITWIVFTAERVAIVIALWDEASTS
jgi:hypothetical protein